MCDDAEYDDDVELDLLDESIGIADDDIDELRSLQNMRVARRLMTSANLRTHVAHNTVSQCSDVLLDATAFDSDIVHKVFLCVCM